MTTLRTTLNPSYSGDDIITISPLLLPRNGTSPVSYEEQVVITTLIVIMGVWSTFGNILTILAITTQPKMLTNCNLFILSLATSDLISGIIASPLWLYRRTWGFYQWNWGQFLCKLYWSTDEATSYCTALHIASFAIWRFVGVKWTFTFESTKRRKIAVWLLILWSIAIIFGGFIFSLYFEVAEKRGTGISRAWPMCSIRLSNNGINEHKSYYTFSSATFMMLPMALLAIASFLLVRELYFQNVVKSKSRKQKERQVAVQLGLISLSFWIGYVPMVSYIMWTTRTTEKPLLFDYWYSVAAYLSLRLSECVNPLMYNAASSKMRTASKNVLNQIRTCGKFKPKSSSKQSKSSRNNSEDLRCMRKNKDILKIQKKEDAAKSSYATI